MHVHITMYFIDFFNHILIFITNDFQIELCNGAHAALEKKTFNPLKSWIFLFFSPGELCMGAQNDIESLFNDSKLVEI